MIDKPLTLVFAHASRQLFHFHVETKFKLAYPHPDGRHYATNLDGLREELFQPCHMEGDLIIRFPETMLPPHEQLQVGDLLLEVSESRRDGRVVVFTHSEHILLRIQRRIRETSRAETKIKEVKPDEYVISIKRPQRGVGVIAEQVGILVFGKDATKPVEVRLDRDGSLLDEWPGGCFLERLGEIV